MYLLILIKYNDLELIFKEWIFKVCYIFEIYMKLSLIFIKRNNRRYLKVIFILGD